MTIKVHVNMSIGYAGSERHAILEFPDGTTDAEIEEECSDWMSNYLDWGWGVVTDEEIVCLQRRYNVEMLEE